MNPKRTYEFLFAYLRCDSRPRGASLDGDGETYFFSRTVKARTHKHAFSQLLRIVENLQDRHNMEGFRLDYEVNIDNTDTDTMISTLTDDPAVLNLIQ